ncbi:MAG: DivIVA domain-containing protein [Clostridia bacterium]|nr:DivIVA domain-containing protein [Clostridia bacterium]
MQITVEMIDTKEFKIKPRGYDQQEVDDFLDAIGDEMVRQLDTIQSLQQQLQLAKSARPAVTEAPTQAFKPVQPAPVAAVPTDSFREILEMAQKVKDETIAEAQRKAEAILAEAQVKASQRLENLDEEKAALTREVDALKAAAAEYRAKFEALLQAQQEALEKAADLF